MVGLVLLEGDKGSCVIVEKGGLNFVGHPNGFRVIRNRDLKLLSKEKLVTKQKKSSSHSSDLYYAFRVSISPASLTNKPSQALSNFQRPLSSKQVDRRFCGPSADCTHRE